MDVISSRKKQLPDEIRHIEFRLMVPRGDSNYVREALPEDLKHKSQEAYWIISCVCSSGMYRKNFDRFVPLNARILRSVVGRYEAKRILDSLLDAGILETNNQYQPRYTSRGYRLTPDYKLLATTKPLFWVNVTNRRLHKALKRFKETQRKGMMKPIDYKLEQFLRKTYIDHQAFDDIRKISHESQAAAFYTISKIENDHLYKIDRYGRRHTTITSLHAPLRKHLRYENKSLSEIDIRNSQPVILMLLLRLIEDKVRRKDLTAALSRFSRRIAQIAEHRGTLESDSGYMDFVASGSVEPRYSPYMMAELPQLLSWQQSKVDSALRQVAKMIPEMVSGIAKYERSVCSGRLYDEIFEAAFGGTLSEDERGRFKQQFFQEVFYGQAKRNTKAKRAFQITFPEVFEIVKVLKKPCWQAFPCLMQHIESEFVIEKAAAEFVNRNPDKPILTIHDSFMVFEEDLDEAENCLREAFSEVDLNPTFKRTIHAIPQADSRTTKDQALA